MKKNVQPVVMPAGTYYIGDLCYVMHNEWDEFCENLSQGLVKLKDGRECCWFYTAYGDGVYQDGSFNEYGVGAGLIGCIKVECIDQSNSDNDIKLGHIYTFDEPFVCKNEDGVLYFGHVIIDTDPSDEDDGFFDLDDDTECKYDD